MFIKRLLAVLLSLVLTFGFFTIVTTATTESSDEFSGKRSIVFTIDSSDFENFVNGGRSAFEFSVRRNAPEWLVYRIASDNHDVDIKIEFTFTSYSDYISKIRELITATPSIYYRAKSDLILIESHTTADLLLFAKAQLNIGGASDEKTLDNVFAIEKNVLEINGKKYSVDNRVQICPQNEVAIKFLGAEIITTENDNGEFEREIILRADSEENINKAKKRFSKVGKTTVENETIKLTLEAVNMSELTEKTMAALRVPVSVYENERFVDNKTVSVLKSEIFDIENLLLENGNFNYTFNASSYYKNITTSNDYISIDVDNNIITASNISNIAFNYQRGFRFDGVEYITDFSNVFGKITKTIRFTARIDKAVPYHKVLKKQFGKLSGRGVTINIYDKGGNRFYDIVYSTWYTNKIQDFVAETLSVGDAKINDSWLPYGLSTSFEEMDISDFMKNMLIPESITATYIFAKGTVFSCASNYDSVLQTSNTLSVNIANNSALEIEYRRVNILKLTVFILIGLIIALLVWECTLYIKKLLKTRAIKEKKTKDINQKNFSVKSNVVSASTTPVSNSKTRFCPYCGSEMPDNISYCGQCGKKTPK